LRAELHPHDGLEVRHHHGHAAEERLQVLRQLLAAGVPGVHGDEVPHRRVEAHVERVAGELEHFGARLLGVLDGQHLLGHHGQDRKPDAVELVEAPPQAGLAQAFEDLLHVAVPLLVRAVGDDHEDAEGAPEVLDGLRLARPGRAGAEEHPEGLGEGDVAPVGEAGDDEALLAAEVLERVPEREAG
jgi:hypothetical protein